MKSRKKIVFRVAILGAFFLALEEMALTHIDDTFEMIATYGLIATLGAGRFVLMTEGVALREVSAEKAKISFRLSIWVAVLFCFYVLGLYSEGVATWRTVFLFLLANFVLVAVEWVFSQRAGLDTLPEVSRLTALVSEKTKEASQLNEENTALTIEVSRQSSEASRQTSRVSELTTELKRFTQMSVGIKALTLEPIRAGNMLVSICPECLTAQAYSVRSEYAGCNNCKK